jgi:hypothetical protein
MVRAWSHRTHRVVRRRTVRGPANCGRRAGLQRILSGGARRRHGGTEHRNEQATRRRQQNSRDVPNADGTAPPRRMEANRHDRATDRLRHPSRRSSLTIQSPDAADIRSTFTVFRCSRRQRRATQREPCVRCSARVGCRRRWPASSRGSTRAENAVATTVNHDLHHVVNDMRAHRARRVRATTRPCRRAARPDCRVARRAACDDRKRWHQHRSR